MKFPHFIFVLLAGLSLWMLQVQGSVQQDIESDIAKADSFYYQGQYTEALALLSQLDNKLAGGNGSTENQSKVKMLYGLTEVALDDTEHARQRFMEFCVLNPNYVIDELQYSRKIVTIFKDAQQDCVKCVQICSRAEAFTAAGDRQGEAEIKSDAEACECASQATVRDNAALKHGRELLAQEKYAEALKEFQQVLTVVPNSAARREAVQTTQTKINSTVDSQIAEWHKLFFSRDFVHAAETYDRIRLLGEQSTEPVKSQILDVAARYQTTFQAVVTSWDAACAKNDKVAVDTIREWGKSLDPNRTIQPAVLDHLGQCPKPQTPGANVAK
jgi:tetratricopeptide (TPR) repeat protein